MTPYLALVLAGFTLFVAVLGVVSLQGWIAALKAKSAPRPAVREARPDLRSGARVH